MEEIDERTEDWLLNMAQIGYKQKQQDVLNKYPGTGNNNDMNHFQMKDNEEIVSVIHAMSPYIERMHVTCFVLGKSRSLI